MFVLWGSKISIGSYWKRWNKENSSSREPDTETVELQSQVGYIRMEQIWTKFLQRVLNELKN